MINMMKRFLSWLMLSCLCCGPAMLAAQSGNLPAFVYGVADWDTLELKDESFNKKDAVMYLIGKQKLEPMFADEKDEKWIEDFHFLDINEDGVVDIIYCGATMYWLGYKTMVFMFQDDGYKLVLDERGYIHSLTTGRDKMSLTMRLDAYGAEYQTVVTRQSLDFPDASPILHHKILMVGPGPGDGGNPDQLEAVPQAMMLPKLTTLRSEPERVDSPRTDWDVDGIKDGDGNIIAEVMPGAAVLRFAGTTDKKGNAWSFVMIVNGNLEPGHVFKNIEEGKTLYMGWVENKALKARQ